MAEIRAQSPSSLEFGAYSAVCSYALFVLLYSTGYNPLGVNSWLGGWIPVLFIVLAVKRDKKLNGGFLGFKQSYKTGFNTTFASALLFAVMLYISMKTFMPDLLEMQRIEAAQELREKRAEYEQLFGKKMYDQMFNSPDITTSNSICMAVFFMKMLGGTICALIVAAIMKRNRPQNQAHLNE